MIIDQTFLKPHWRTVQWWREREQCAQCKHMAVRPTRSRTKGVGSDLGGGWVCAAVMRGPGTGTTCIDARDRDCGPDAKLFEGKENGR